MGMGAGVVHGCGLSGRARHHCRRQMFQRGRGTPQALHDRWQLGLGDMLPRSPFFDTTGVYLTVLVCFLN